MYIRRCPSVSPAWSAIVPAGSSAQGLTPTLPGARKLGGFCPVANHQHPGLLLVILHFLKILKAKLLEYALIFRIQYIPHGI